jgi:lipopolysaccharide exporter
MNQVAGAPTDSIRNRTVIAASWMVAWRMATRVLGLGSTLVLAHILIPADFGLVAMATTFSASIDSLSALGIQDALIRRADNDRGLFDTAFTMQAARGLVTASIVSLGAWPISTWFAEPRLFAILLILAATSALAGFENIGVVEFRHALRFDKEFKLLFVPRIGQVAITIGCVLALQSYWALVVGIVSSRLLRLIVTYVIHPYRPRLGLMRWRDLVGFSFWTWAAGLAYLVWERADPFVYGPVIGAGSLGVLMLAGEIAVLPITELVAPAAAALFAGVARAQDRGADMVELAMPIALTLSLVTIPLAIGISGTSGYLVAALLGEKWQAAQQLIAIISALCIFSPFSFVCMTVLVARGHVRRNFFGIGLAAAVKLLMLIVVTSITRRLDALCLVAVTCAFVEAASLMAQLHRVGNMRFRASLRPLIRIAAAGTATVTTLYVSGLGWRTITMPAGTALLQGGVLGLAIVVIFGLIQGGLWLLDGRPEGLESRFLEIMSPLMARTWRLRKP